jgi:hypothetical protein
MPHVAHAHPMETFIAVAGIAGTLIAGLGGIYMGAYLARKAEDRREAVEIRRAARVIDADLLFAEAAGVICVEKKKWWIADRRLTLDGWEKYRDVIAPHLLWRDWAALGVAVQAVRDLQDSRDRARTAQLAEIDRTPETRDAYAAGQARNVDISDQTPPLDESTVNQIKPMYDDVHAGRGALVALTGVPVRVA